MDRQHPHQERGAQAAADRAENANGQIRLAAAHGRGGEHGLRGRDAAQAHVEGLLKSLNKLEHARWDYNPHDTRGQGNMGKVDMRSPFGFDKDSGREGAERGRAIHPEPEPVLDLSTLVSISFQPTDYFVSLYQFLLNHVLTYWDLHLQIYGSSYLNWYVDYIRRMLDYYTVRSQYTWSVAANMDQPVDYTVSIGDVPTTFEGDTLLVTLNLISLGSYDSTFWGFTSGWTSSLITVHYDAGQIVETQTQEVTLSDGGTFSFSYDPYQNLVGWNGGYFQLAVTVTDPVSGATYTTTLDRQVYMFRCPYGIVYDKTTSRPIVGATVTIHNADGSLVVLDKAANPNVSNPQTTDATGRYNAKLAIGKKYYLTVKAPGYEEYRSSLFSERWHIVREDVGLTPVNSQVTSAAVPALHVPASVGGEGQGELLKPGLGISPTVLPAK